MEGGNDGDEDEMFCNEGNSLVFLERFMLFLGALSRLSVFLDNFRLCNSF